MIAYGNVVAVVAPERSGNIGIFLCTADNFLYKNFLSLFIFKRKIVVLSAKIFNRTAFIAKLFVAHWIIHLRIKHFFFFSHNFLR